MELGFRLYKIIMTNDLSWFTYGFTWKGVTTGLAHCAVKVFVSLSHTGYNAGCGNRMSAHHTSQKSSLLDFSAFDPLTPATCAHMFLDWWMHFLYLPDSYWFQFISAWYENQHQRLAWKRVIHHNGHLVIIILSRGGYVNGCMVMHLKGSDCFKMFSSADGKLQQPRLGSDVSGLIANVLMHKDSKFIFSSSEVN